MIGIAHEFANAINSDKIVRIILFGSVARGEDTEDSAKQSLFAGTPFQGLPLDFVLMILNYFSQRGPPNSISFWPYKTWICSLEGK